MERLNVKQSGERQGARWGISRSLAGSTGRPSSIWREAGPWTLISSPTAPSGEPLAPPVERLPGEIGRSYFLNLSAFAMTETEEKLIVALAMIGLSRIPNHGYSTPAATGTPTAL